MSSDESWLMTPERYLSLIKEESDLTEDEINNGWHWCYELDGSLENMRHTNEFCHCMILDSTTNKYQYHV